MGWGSSPSPKAPVQLAVSPPCHSARRRAKAAEAPAGHGLKGPRALGPVWARRASAAVPPRPPPPTHTLASPGPPCLRGRPRGPGPSCTRGSSCLTLPAARGTQHVTRCRCWGPGGRVCARQPPRSVGTPEPTAALVPGGQRPQHGVSLWCTEPGGLSITAAVSFLFIRSQPGEASAPDQSPQETRLLRPQGGEEDREVPAPDTGTVRGARPGQAALHPELRLRPQPGGHRRSGSPHAQPDRAQLMGRQAPARGVGRPGSWSHMVPVGVLVAGMSCGSRPPRSRTRCPMRRPGLSLRQHSSQGEQWPVAQEACVWGLLPGERTEVDRDAHVQRRVWGPEGPCCSHHHPPAQRGSWGRRAASGTPHPQERRVSTRMQKRLGPSRSQRPPVSCGRRTRRPRSRRT